MSDEGAKFDVDVEAKAKRKVKVVEEKVKRFEVKADTAPEVVLELASKGYELLFDADDLPELADSVVDDLRFHVANAYFKALNKKKDAAKTVNPQLEVLGILGGNALRKLTLRKRRGYHQTWKRPEELDVAKDNGYMFVRKQEKDSEEPGQESGEIMRIGAKDSPELFAMEIKQDLYDRHLQAVSSKSNRAYKNMKEDFATSVEQINRSTRRGSDKIVVVDDEGDI